MYVANIDFVEITRQNHNFDSLSILLNGVRNIIAYVKID